MSRHASFTCLTFCVFILMVASTNVLADSHVRIVRLSSVEGQVRIDRGTGQGLEKAILNMPIVEGTRIVTGDDGLAEIEYENQSALRLTEDTEVKFSQLLMNDAGTKINQMTVVKGLVYLDTASKGNDIYRVTVGDKTMLVARDTLMRLTATPEQIQIAVLKGDVQLEQSQPLIVHKKETLAVDLKSGADDTIAKGVEPVRFDKWNSEREDYGKTYADNQGYGGPSRAYGLQDLNYYGDFFYANGYGYVWQPFGFSNAMMNWDPYSNGAWMFYPGMGYAWASGYPWGWLPYHYGSWAFINGAGWAWVPGRYNGQWYTTGYQAVPRITKAPAGWTAATPPATTALAGSGRTVLVGKAGTTPLSIPGGRIPPNFASLVPGRLTGPSAVHGFVKPNTTAANRAVFAPPQSGLSAMHNGHVFATPASRSVFADEVGMHQPFGGRSGGVNGAASAHGGTSVGGASSSAGSSGTSGGHK